MRPHAAHGIVRDVANAARSLHACRPRIALERTCNEPSYLRSGPCLSGIAAPRLPWVLKAAAGGGGASLACASRRSVPPARRYTLRCRRGLRLAREASLHEPPAAFSCVRIGGGTRRSVGGSAHVSATATYRVPSDAPSAALSIGPGLVVLRAPVLASSLSSPSTAHRRCEVTGVEQTSTALRGVTTVSWRLRSRTVRRIGHQPTGFGGPAGVREVRNRPTNSSHLTGGGCLTTPTERAGWPRGSACAAWAIPRASASPHPIRWPSFSRKKAAQQRRRRRAEFGHRGGGNHRTSARNPRPTDQLSEDPSARSQARPTDQRVCARGSTPLRSPPRERAPPPRGEVQGSPGRAGERQGQHWPRARRATCAEY